MQRNNVRNWTHAARALGSTCLVVMSTASCGSAGDSAASAVDNGAPGTFTEIYDTILSTDTDSRCNFCHSMPASQVSNGMFHTGKDKAETYAALIDRTSMSMACAARSR